MPDVAPTNNRPSESILILSVGVVPVAKTKESALVSVQIAALLFPLPSCQPIAPVTPVACGSDNLNSGLAVPIPTLAPPIFKPDVVVSK